MADEQLEQALRSVDPRKRAFVKQLVVGTAFAIPAVASYSVRDLAVAQVGSPSGITVCTSLLSTITTDTTIDGTSFNTVSVFTTTTCFTVS